MRAAVALAASLTSLVAPLAAHAMTSAAVKPALPKSDARADMKAVRVYDFGRDKAGAPPAGFTFVQLGEGKPGRWVVEPSKDKGRGQVVVQRELEPNKKRFVMAISDAPPMTDASLKVRCKMVSGSKDQACGLVFRQNDKGDHYLVRADTEDLNLRLYAVRNGVRGRIAEFPTRMSPGVWNELTVHNKGTRIVVFWNGLACMDVHDSSISGAGRAGLWTKSDALVEFDDLHVGPFVEFWVRPSVKTRRAKPVRATESKP